MRKVFLQLDPLALPDVINHLVISHCEEIRFGCRWYHLFPVHPHFFKSRLHDITGVLLVLQVFQDKPVNAISIIINTPIVFPFCHVALVEMVS
jgi:hypothetical protein